MNEKRRISFIEPMGRPGRLMGAWAKRWPLLGPITLGTILQKLGFNVVIHNENITGSVFEDPTAMDDLLRADVVGISIMTPTAPRGYEIARRLRQAGAGATIVFGGSHATFMPHEALQHGDVVVKGEAESLIQAIAAGEIANGIVSGEPLENLDELPTLNHSLVRGFDQMVEQRNRLGTYELPVMTSRGCPYGCTYCSVTKMFGRHIRRQSVHKVCSDLEQYALKGFKQFFFYDDNFTADRHWCRRVLEWMAPNGWRFNAQSRIDFHWLDTTRQELDRRLLAQMQRAGADILFVGYETIDDTTAADWHKGYRGSRTLRERMKQDTAILHDHNIWIHAMFVLGPEHTRQIADGIVDFARGCKLESLQVAALTPFPGTDLFVRAKDNLLFNDFPGDWDYYDGAHCVYRNSRLGIEEFQRKLLELHRQFYRWGGLSLRRARSLIRKPGGMLRKVQNVWSNARLARDVMRNYAADVESYIQLARCKLSRLAELSSIAGVAK